jgi:HD-GYP domain-containing protein (c-di-GMP phosphodiesterase class II)
MSETKNGEGSLAELLCALSFVSDVGMGQAMGHGLKTAYIGLRIAEAAGLSLEDQQAVYYGALLKDAGCTACAGVFATFFEGDDLGPRSDCLMLRPDSVKDAVAWFWRHAPNDPALPSRIANLFSFLSECKAVMREGVAAHCEVGSMFASRLALPQSIQEAVRFGWERWDGKGLAYGRKGGNVPTAARILHLAQIVEAAHFFGSRPAAEAIVRERRGADFDPEIADLLLPLATRDGFWQVIESDSVQEQVLARKPASDFDLLTEERLANACELLADFADAKSRKTWNHSLQVAEVAAGIGRQMGLGAQDLARLRRAALVHDLGKAAVPVGILDKDHDFSATEWERFRLHPYYTERVLSQVAPLRDLAQDAAAHHERVDGGGYHKQLQGQQIPLIGRILATADAYTLLLQGSKEQEEALAQTKTLAGTQLEPACYEGLVASVQAGQAQRVSRSKRPGDLTDREVEVLRLAALGRSNREIAGELVISGKTVEHHLEHVFNKLGVTSRTAAAVFAMQNGLAP